MHKLVKLMIERHSLWNFFSNPIIPHVSITLQSITFGKFTGHMMVGAVLCFLAAYLYFWFVLVFMFLCFLFRYLYMLIFSWIYVAHFMFRYLYMLIFSLTQSREKISKIIYISRLILRRSSESLIVQDSGVQELLREAQLWQRIADRSYIGNSFVLSKKPVPICSY